MRGRRPATLIVLLLSACATVHPATSADPESTTTTVPSDTTTTTSAPAATTTTVLATTTTEPPPREVDAEVFDPPRPGPHPAVVLVHGGSWVGGSPASLEGLARRLQDDGFLVVNTRYTLASLRRPGFPAALEDIACAVRFAASHPESDGTVSLIGHSAGAHLAAVVALTGDLYGEECTVGAPAVAGRFVGLAGPYDVTRIGLLAVPFFGATPDEAPEIWAAANPMGLVVEGSDLRALVVHGEDDNLVDIRFAEDFVAALDEGGLVAAMEAIPGAGHMSVTDPDVVGDLIAAWLTN